MSDNGQEYARKLELLLALFLRPDGRTWRGSDIESATDGAVTQSYFSQLKRGRWQRPGLEPLAEIADVMNFPFDLWRTDPERWPAILNRQSDGDWYLGTSEDIAAKFNGISRSVRKPDGNPYSDEEIALNSEGRISAEEVNEIRHARARQVTYDQILVLSDVFQVDFDYWKKPGGNDAPIFDDELLELMEDADNQLLMQRTRNLSKAHKDMLLILAEQMQRTQLSSGQDSGQDSGQEDDVTD
jgi:transcriptional regulator with XRE-family HTH domain